MCETTTLTHDLLGRPTSIDGPWTDDTVTYDYNDATRSVTRSGPGGITQTSTGDAFGRIASVANILGTFTHGYDDTLVGGSTTAISTLLQSITHTGANAGFNTAFTYHGDALDHALATITSTKPGAATMAAIAPAVGEGPNYPVAGLAGQLGDLGGVVLARHLHFDGFPGGKVDR